MFVDGSCKKNLDGKIISGYAVVTLDEVLKSSSLPLHFSAEAAELVALTEACKTLHVFAQLWENRGMVTSTGKPFTHKALTLPQQHAV